MRENYAQAYLRDGDSTSWMAHLRLVTAEAQAYYNLLKYCKGLLKSLIVWSLQQCSDLNEESLRINPNLQVAHMAPSLMMSQKQKQ